MNINRIYTPFLSHFRRSRMKLLYRTMKITQDTRVLDIGGYPSFWKAATKLGLPLPKLTFLNLAFHKGDVEEGNMNLVIGDGKTLPFSDSTFDLAFSNSVIEHLGGWEPQVQFAGEIRRVARQHFVQTPDVLFPIEPHYITPFVHWCSPAFRTRLLRNFTVWGIVTRPTKEQCISMVEEIRLLSVAEMRRLFPQSGLVRERFLGLSKDFVAIGERPR